MSNRSATMQIESSQIKNTHHTYGTKVVEVELVCQTTLKIPATFDSTQKMFMACSLRDRADLVNSFLSDCQEHIDGVYRQLDTDSLDNMARILKHAGHVLVED